MNPTKEKILQIGASIVRQKGFNHTGIQEILTEAGVPKGSFYFYFRNKEEFGLEVIDTYVNYFSTQMESVLTNRNLSGIKRLKKFFKFFNDLFESENYTGGCPLGNLAQEMGDMNESFRLKLSDSLRKMEKFIKVCIDDAIDSDEIKVDLNSTEFAAFILNSWEGAVLRMKVEKSVKPIKLLEKTIIKFFT